LRRQKSNREQAYSDGAAKLSAQVKDANARLFALVDSMHKLAAEESAK
jgi:hypothetical protein